MDLEARALSDLRRIEAICCEHARGGTRKCLIDRIRQCQQRPIQVLPCRAPRLCANTYRALLDILQSLDWRPFSYNKGTGVSRTGASGSANFVLGASKGIPGSRGYAHVVNKNFSGHVHVDRNDTTYQYALSLGDFASGGHLVMSTDDPYRYVKYDTKGRLTRCDGRHPHWVTRHQGGRQVFPRLLQYHGQTDAQGIQPASPKRALRPRKRLWTGRPPAS